MRIDLDRDPTEQHNVASSDPRQLRTTAELEGFCKLTYKAIPSSSEEIGKMLGAMIQNPDPFLLRPDC